ncbi:hypothetical protein KAI12_04810 [Candidatus Bathyarchaeota archaeon]|nr:hypothetical protein [Candidatus Bathyarchaeota archaeon]
MTCYFRHIRKILEKGGIEATKENKREIDMAIHRIVGVEYKNCSATWKKVKERIADEPEAFVFELKTALAK